MPQLRFILNATIVFSLLAGGQRVLAAAPTPCWIWSSEETVVERPTQFSRRFKTTAESTSLRLRFATVCARIEITLNNKIIAAAEPYAPLRDIKIEKALRSGEHQLAVEAIGEEGPSSFFLQLAVFSAGKLDADQTIVTDSTWRDSSGVRASKLGHVDRRFLTPPEREVGIDVVDNYEQWKQALGGQGHSDPATFDLTPGFEIQLVRRALPGEDSWVSLTFDREGRAIIAKEKQGLLRMTLSPEGGESTTELIEDTLEECRGLAFIDNDLFANANNSKGLYRLRGSEGEFSKPELLFGSTGGVGHGRNDLAVGPAGKLYSIHGDSVDLPTNVVDMTSPFREARRGKKTSEGHLLQIDPESEAVAIIAAGLRNPFGIDFNNDGEAFTYDADAEFDMGTPWYRPTRVNHLVAGGDYGWRGVTGTWPPYYPDHPDNAHFSLDVGKGSPTAIKFGTKSNFPPPFDGALFILDWAYGRILAIHMLPRGSSYLMSGETFLQGRPLNVTDLDFAPDGNMYFITGGRQTQSALYRIRYVGPRPQQRAKSAYHETLIQFSRKARRLRRALESDLVQPPNSKSVDRAWEHLSAQDPWIRQAAFNLLEHQPIATWSARALAEQDPSTAIQALTALARSQSVPSEEIVRRMNEIDWEVESETSQLSAYQVYRLCLTSPSELSESLRQETTTKVNAMYPSGSSSNAYLQNQMLSDLLVRLEANDVVEKTMALMAAATEQAEQLHYLHVLRNTEHGWTMRNRRLYFARLAMGKHYQRGAGMSGFLEKIRSSAIATLTEQEHKRLGPLLDDTASTAQTSSESKPRQHVKKWTVDDVLGAIDSTYQADLTRGRRVFSEASCIHCHQHGSLGTPIGPDLTSVSRRFGHKDLLTSIISPSESIAENYRGIQIITTDGRTFFGQPKLGGDFRSPLLRLATNPLQPMESIEIPKNEIESQSESKTSWMPSGLLDNFERHEILDLLNYLGSPQ